MIGMLVFMFVCHVGLCLCVRVLLDAHLVRAVLLGFDRFDSMVVDI